MDGVDHIVMRILDQFDISTDLVERWTGEMKNRSADIQSII